MASKGDSQAVPADPNNRNNSENNSIHIDVWKSAALICTFITCRSISLNSCPHLAHEVLFALVCIRQSGQLGGRLIHQFDKTDM